MEAASFCEKAAAKKHLKWLQTLDKYWMHLTPDLDQLVAMKPGSTGFSNNEASRVTIVRPEGVTK